MAVALIGLVVTALAAITTAVTADVRRTRQLESDAQFRQLLLAGAADAAEHARSWGEAPEAQSWALTLPEALTERGYRVQMSLSPSNDPAKTNAVEVRVDAGNATAIKVQILRFVRAESEWKLRAVVAGESE